MYNCISEKPMTSPSCLSPAPTGLRDGAADTAVQFADLVRRVREGDASGMADLYECISTGLRPFLGRQLPSQDLRDKVHNIFLDVVVAIRGGQLREPQRLMGFARTIARRKVSGYIG